MLNDPDRGYTQRGLCKADLMRRIRELGFAVIEARIYLDVYDSADASQYLEEKSNELAEACSIYEQKFGPLTVSAQVSGWVETPWPWESEAN